MSLQDFLIILTNLIMYMIEQPQSIWPYFNTSSLSLICHLTSLNSNTLSSQEAHMIRRLMPMKAITHCQFAGIDYSSGRKHIGIESLPANTSMRHTPATHRLATINVEHSLLKFLAGDLAPFRHASTLAQWCKQEHLNLISTQETTPHVVGRFKKSGYQCIDADRLTKENPLHWRGLSCFFDGDYQLKPASQSIFTAYKANERKTWKCVRSALQLLLQSLITKRPEDSFDTRCTQLAGALAGVLRQDGFLIVPLEHQSTQHEVLLCNTHLESFHPGIREAQTQELILHLKSLQEQHPEANIMLTGDFNRPHFDREYQGQHHVGLRYLFQDALGAQSLPSQAIASTHTNNQCIDGIFALPTARITPIKIDGKTSMIKNPKDLSPISDHNAVQATIQFELTEKATNDFSFTDSPRHTINSNKTLQTSLQHAPACMPSTRSDRGSGRTI